VSKASRTYVLSATLALGVGLVLAPAAMAQVQPPQGQPPPGQQQSQPPTPDLQQKAQPPAPDLQQIWQMHKMQIRARIAAAVQQLRTACDDELRNFCSTVTPGEGRLLLCMQAHEDKISLQCELTLLETLRNVGGVVQRVETFAKACWQDIQARCSGTGGSVMQCMADYRASLSRTCQAIVADILPGTQQGQLPPAQGTMIGLPIYSADGMVLGQVTGLKRRDDGSLEAIEAELGSPLGLGGTSVLISPGELHWRGDGVELQMMADQVRSVLQGQKQ
jgi:cysteine rich repeat protein